MHSPGLHSAVDSAENQGRGDNAEMMTVTITITMTISSARRLTCHAALRADHNLRFILRGLELDIGAED